MNGFYESVADGKLFNGLGSLERGPRCATGRKKNGADNYHSTNHNSKSYRQRNNQGRYRGNRNYNDPQSSNSSGQSGRGNRGEGCGGCGNQIRDGGGDNNNYQ